MDAHSEDHFNLAHSGLKCIEVEPRPSLSSNPNCVFTSEVARLRLPIHLHHFLMYSYNAEGSRRSLYMLHLMC